MELERLAEQNPWWREGATFGTDHHLARFDGMPLKLVHPVEAKVGLASIGMQVMRGPRQIGKTTLLKRLIRSLVEKGTDSRRVLYLALDIADIRNQLDLLDALRTFVRASRGAGKRYVLLDEITHCPEWATGLKAAADLGILDEVYLLATGSHALDIAKGTERLPGRRGALEAGFNLEMGHFPFSAIAAAVCGAEAAASSSWDPEELVDTARENSVRVSGYQDAFRIFLRAGGLPRPLADTITGGDFSLDTAALHKDAVLGDILRAGKSEPQLRDILRAVVLARGSALSWHGLAERIASGSKNTVAEYLDTVRACYLVEVLPQPASLGSRTPAPRKPRKVLFRDPFLHHVFGAWATGAADPRDAAAACLANPESTGVLVESAMAGQLHSHFSQIMHWRDSGEIDMIGVTGTGKQVRFEVKYQSQITSRDKKHLKAAGGGFVVSRNTTVLDRAAKVAIIPAPLLLLSAPRNTA